MLAPDAFDALLRELETTADAYWNVGRDNAQLLALLVKSVNARRVLEVGTSNGYSTLWFARALEEIAPGAGQVVAIEFDASRAARARENFRKAGVDHVITLLEGDARALIAGQPTEPPFDFVFLDAEKSEYAAYLHAALPLVRSGGLIVGDDTLSLRAEMTHYVELAFSHPGLESVEVPIDDGIIVSRKR